jgi:hypothetical protein
MYLSIDISSTLLSCSFELEYFLDMNRETCVRYQLVIRSEEKDTPSFCFIRI